MQSSYVVGDCQTNILVIRKTLDHLIIYCHSPPLTRYNFFSSRSKVSGLKNVKWICIFLFHLICFLNSLTPLVALKCCCSFKYAVGGNFFVNFYYFIILLTFKRIAHIPCILDIVSLILLNYWAAFVLQMLMMMMMLLCIKFTCNYIVVIMHYRHWKMSSSINISSGNWINKECAREWENVVKEN